MCFASIALAALNLQEICKIRTKKWVVSRVVRDDRRYHQQKLTNSTLLSCGRRDKATSLTNVNCGDEKSPG